MHAGQELWLEPASGDGLTAALELHTYGSGSDFGDLLNDLKRAPRPWAL